MIEWQISPDSHREAGERFLGTGAPTPEGVTTVGRWHAPGSVRGWIVVETDDLGALGQHVAEWAGLLDLDVTPVGDDEMAGAALAKVYG